MRNVKFFLAVLLSATILAISLTGRADEQKPKPYPLDTCLVCGMKLRDMEAPFVFIYKGQELRVCGKSEKEAFEKKPAKYLKKLEDAKAKLKK